MAILGELGAGKTLSLTYLAVRNHLKGRDVYSNYNLEFKHTKIQTPDDILNMTDGFAALDELWTWADSRVSGSKRNKFITLVLAKSRKRGINIAYTVQYFKQIDIRIRTVTDFIAIPYMSRNMNRCNLFVHQNPSMRLEKVYKFRTDQIFKLYNTKEEVKSLEFD